LSELGKKRGAHRNPNSGVLERGGRRRRRRTHLNGAELVAASRTPPLELGKLHEVEAVERWKKRVRVGRAMGEVGVECAEKTAGL
jgi:hypothetical protein